MPSRLRWEKGESGLHCNRIQLYDPRGGPHLGKEPGGPRRAGTAAKSSGRVGGEGQDSRGEIEFLPRQWEKEEQEEGQKERQKEGEKEEERVGGGKRKEEEIWRENGGKETVESPVSRNGYGPRCQDPKESVKEGSKAVEKIKRNFRLIFSRFFIGFRRKFGRRSDGRQNKDPTHFSAGARHPSSLFNQGDEGVRHASKRVKLGHGRGVFAPSDEPICEAASSRQVHGRPPARSHVIGVDRRPPDAGEGGRRVRLPLPKIESGRIDGLGAPMECSSAGGDYTTSGAPYFDPSRNSERSKGGQAGSSCETREPEFRRERKRQEPRKGQRQKQTRQRKRQRQWRRQKECRKGRWLLRQGEQMLKQGLLGRENKETRMNENALAIEPNKKLLKGGDGGVPLKSQEDSRQDTRAGPKEVDFSFSPERMGHQTWNSSDLRLPQIDHARFEGMASPAATGLATEFCTVSPNAESQQTKDLGMDQAKKDSECGESDGISMSGIFHWLGSRIDVLLKTLCTVKPTGKIFPLPTSSAELASVFPLLGSDVLCVLRCLVVSLNSLNGEGLRNSSSPTRLQREVLEGLVPDCRRVLSWPSSSTRLSWEQFFRVKGVDYKGEEVQTARPICWENVSPALPNEVGQVNLEEVVELGSKEYVLNFPEYLLPEEEQVYTKPPKVMVAQEDWEPLCKNLMQRGVFSRVHESEVFKVGGKPVLNGLFGVSKHEFSGNYEVMRIIMNLIPTNRLRRALESDLSTLPSWAGMTPLVLEPEENLVVSSEDVRCFFYIFRLPEIWKPLMAFNRPLPQSLCGDRPGLWYPCSAVLPMGFKNFVSLAQHVHRFIMKRALGKLHFGGELELRKDKVFPRGDFLFRIYLDNFDELRKVSKDLAEAIEGKASPLVLGLREEYQVLGVPRHPKKAVASSMQAEVQGALVCGDEGVAFPKPEKILKYSELALLLLQSDTCTQKQAQVVGGGLVYFTMFRRPLLGCLNWLWRFILSFGGFPPVVKLPIPPEVKLELARFVGLVPLAFMNFRSRVSPVVTASDASTVGGGVTMSQTLTPAGRIAAQCKVRGDVLEPADTISVLTIGLFDGIGALRVAADSLGWNVVGHVSVEKSDAAARVVESRFPNSIRISDVRDINSDTVTEWALQFSQVSLIVIGAGPPCQGVSGLNASRKGALRDARSSLFAEVSMIRTLVRTAFPWAQVQSLMESVASMDDADESVMSKDFGTTPWLIDASEVSLARRPRLYWVEWELVEGHGCVFDQTKRRPTVLLNCQVDPKDFLLPGWHKTSAEPFPTFTTSRPRDRAGYKPAGLNQCNDAEKTMWAQDSHRFPPYQYQFKHCLINGKGDLRLPSIEEREVIMGFPRNYTMSCMPKASQGSVAHTDCRLSLVGNSWNVVVVSWLLSQLGARLGLNEVLTPQDLADRCAPGSTTDFQTFLQRPLMSHKRKCVNLAAPKLLVQKLLNMVSIKGEDILIQSSSEDQVKYYRLRSSVPSKLWKWKTVTGWRWSSSKEHINVLEMRATLTALRWRLERRGSLNTKFVHLLDSLVCLHSLSRGRSSSLKLKRSLLRINALLLATHSSAVWAYVHTKDNPADAPSRYPRKRKWCNA